VQQENSLMKTANAVGLDVPHRVARADEVIE
jgi:hypothetical protein